MRTARSRRMVRRPCACMLQGSCRVPCALHALLNHIDIMPARHGCHRMLISLTYTIGAELWAKPSDSSQQGKPRRRATAVPDQNAENIDDDFVEDPGPLPEQQPQQVCCMHTLLLPVLQPLPPLQCAQSYCHAHQRIAVCPLDRMMLPDGGPVLLSIHHECISIQYRE